MESHYVLERIESGNPPEGFILDGKHPAMINAAKKVRLNIVEWYRRFLTREVKELGMYTENSEREKGRYWQRGDLLALEMVRKGVDVKESGPDRERVMLEYLAMMNNPFEWGSTPEIQAAACMIKKTVNTWQHEPSGKVMLINVAIGNCEETVTPHCFTPQSSSAAPTACLVSESKMESDAELYEDVSEESSDKILLGILKKRMQEKEGDEVEDEEDEDEEDEEKLDKCFNLYFRGNHYDAMITPRQFHILALTYGSKVLSHFIPMY